MEIAEQESDIYNTSFSILFFFLHFPESKTWRFADWRIHWILGKRLAQIRTSGQQGTHWTLLAQGLYTAHVDLHVRHVLNRCREYLLQMDAATWKAWQGLKQQVSINEQFPVNTAWILIAYIMESDCITFERKLNKFWDSFLLIYRIQGYSLQDPYELVLTTAPVKWLAGWV